MIATMPTRVAAPYARPYSLRLFELPLKLPELDIAVPRHPRATYDPAMLWSGKV
jgi:hypothetical protein